MENYNYFLLDTFTSEAFKGNPTPVCILEKPIREEKLNLLAKEFNCPVTVFILNSDKRDTYQIRYFTVTGEIPACGHGTLGGAHILFRKNQRTDSIRFETIEGIELNASKEDETIFIDYPKFGKADIKPNAKIIEALGLKSTKAYFICEELESLFIELESDEEIRKVTPDFEKLIQCTDKIKEVVIMSESKAEEFDFTLRSFCPWIGINEDPVTGSIHSVLGHYWKNRLDKDVLTVNQASERGGKIIVKPLENAVKIGGNCKIIVKGKIDY